MVNSMDTYLLEIPLEQTARNLALQFASEQANPQKGKRVYFNTLAVWAVNYFLEWMELETDLDAVKVGIQECGRFMMLRIWFCRELARLNAVRLYLEKRRFLCQKCAKIALHISPLSFRNLSIKSNFWALFRLGKLWMKLKRFLSLISNQLRNCWIIWMN